jgi:FkbM family methyltransferase
VVAYRRQGCDRSEERASLIKTLNLLDQQVSFSASDDDYYLQTLPANGPSDIQHLFEAFCEEDSNVIDVGANIGVTAVIAGLLALRGSVLALEPVKDTFDYLAANIDRSTLTNVTCRNVAAASAPGHVQVVTRPGHSFASFVGYDEVLERYAGYDEEQVEAVTLDQLVEREGVGRVDFVKIDVEGFELEVLRGCTQVLKQSQPTVFLEANHYCLNIFRRISMVDFTEEVLSYFPIVYAVDASSETLDLTLKTNHPVFFHDNVVRGRYQNLLCGFDPSIKSRLERLRSKEQTPDDSVPLPVDTGMADKVRRRVGNLLPRKRVDEKA